MCISVDCKLAGCSHISCTITRDEDQQTIPHNIMESEEDVFDIDFTALVVGHSTISVCCEDIEVPGRVRKILFLCEITKIKLNM